MLSKTKSTFSKTKIVSFSMIMKIFVFGSMLIKQLIYYAAELKGLPPRRHKVREGI